MSAVQIHVPICKVQEELQVVKGPVLRPEVRDRHQTIIAADVVQKAAHDFLEDLNLANRPGFMHKEFDRDLKVVESYISEVEETYEIKGKDGKVHKVTYPAGTWFLAMKVYEDTIWDGVKNGVFRGFSIGAVATVKYEDDTEKNTVTAVAFDRETVWDILWNELAAA